MKKCPPNAIRKPLVTTPNRVAATKASGRHAGGVTGDVAGIAEATGQTWPTKMADLLVEMTKAVRAAKADGKNVLPARRLASYRRRYRGVIGEGKAAHPPPPPTGPRPPPPGAAADDAGSRGLVWLPSPPRGEGAH